MDKLIALIMATVAIASIAIGIQSLKDLNDGRVLSAIQSMHPHILGAHAAEGPLTRSTVTQEQLDAISDETGCYEITVEEFNNL